MNFEQYHVFYHVARLGNFTHAAAALMTSQPAVTRTIRALEDELGCRLFVRGRRGVELTPEGGLLYRYVAEAYERLEKGQAEVASAVGLESGTVYLGATETALQAWLPARLERFRARYPGVKLRIQNMNVREGVEAVRSGQIDLALVSAPANARRPLREIRLHAYRDVVIAGPQYAALRGRTLRLRELAEYPLICLSTTTRTREFLNAFCQQHGLTLEADIEPSTADLILPLVRHNLGVGILPDIIAARAIAEGEVFAVEIAEELPQRYICAVYDSSRPMGAAASRLLESLCAEVDSGKAHEKSLP